MHGMPEDPLCSKPWRNLRTGASTDLSIFLATPPPDFFSPCSDLVLTFGNQQNLVLLSCELKCLSECTGETMEYMPKLAVKSPPKTLVPQTASGQNQSGKTRAKTMVDLLGQMSASSCNLIAGEP